MRAGERDGVDYQFVSKEQFEDWIANDQLLEHAVVYGQYKGIPRTQITDALSRGSDVVLRLDVQVRCNLRRGVASNAPFLCMFPVHSFVQHRIERADSCCARECVVCMCH